MIARTVGATSAKVPGSPSTSKLPLSPVTMNGTGSKGQLEFLDL